MSCCLPEQAEKSCDLGNFPKSTAPLKGHFTCGCLHRMPITDFHLAQQEDNQTAGAALARSRVAAWLQAVGVRTFKKDHPPSTSSIGVTWQRERKEKRAKATTTSRSRTQQQELGCSHTQQQQRPSIQQQRLIGLTSYSHRAMTTNILHSFDSLRVKLNDISLVVDFTSYIT